jgi:hypothetical protein
VGQIQIADFSDRPIYLTPQEMGDLFAETMAFEDQRAVVGFAFIIDHQEASGRHSGDRNTDI